MPTERLLNRVRAVLECDSCHAPDLYVECQHCAAGMHLDPAGVLRALGLPDDHGAVATVADALTRDDTDATTTSRARLILLALERYLTDAPTPDPSETP